MALSWLKTIRPNELPIAFEGRYCLGLVAICLLLLPAFVWGQELAEPPVLPAPEFVPAEEAPIALPQTPPVPNVHLIPVNSGGTDSFVLENTPTGISLVARDAMLADLLTSLATSH